MEVVKFTAYVPLFDSLSHFISPQNAIHVHKLVQLEWNETTGHRTFTPLVTQFTDKVLLGVVNHAVRLNTGHVKEFTFTSKYLARVNYLKRLR